ncbi:hypothetical protein M407DRAFT_161453 [Tulasnella calospora MUT 4182]|uniref:Uncharacterized protein n=1 Tax=Tulasnella calospora MUT 4182 TaxID=1051891 RepID=A0A0C3L7Y7_9AGAM|nr:hypothetical protein M407DRAFT_161453 [Tulasnella calospora MUT 4182]
MKKIAWETKRRGWHGIQRFALSFDRSRSQMASGGLELRTSGYFKIDSREIMYCEYFPHFKLDICTAYTHVQYTTANAAWT